MKKFKSGEKAPFDGEYDIYGKQENLVKTNITMHQGDNFPPTPKSQQYYVLKKKIVKK